MPDPVYDNSFMRRTARSSAGSAEIITSHLSNVLEIGSVLDVGCATGTWLRSWMDRGVADIQGIDGSYVDTSSLEIPISAFSALDLKQGFALGRRFDLVQCLEVAEHLPAETSIRLVAALAEHASRLVLFSAAPPGQGGEFHVNEQDYDFWRVRFARFGFRPFDYLRPLIRSHRSVTFWYRYNIILYVRDVAIHDLPGPVLASAVADDAPIPDVSPPSFRLRKAMVRLLPSKVQHEIARLKSRIATFGARHP